PPTPVPYAGFFITLSDPSRILDGNTHNVYVFVLDKDANGNLVTVNPQNQSLSASPQTFAYTQTQIAGPYDSHNARIEMTTSGQYAGAFKSLKYNGQEFLNSNDHGRLLQSDYQAATYNQKATYSGVT